MKAIVGIYLYRVKLGKKARFYEFFIVMKVNRDYLILLIF